MSIHEIVEKLLVVNNTLYEPVNGLSIISGVSYSGYRIYDDWFLEIEEKSKRVHLWNIPECKTYRVTFVDSEMEFSFWLGKLLAYLEFDSFEEGLK